MEAAKGMAMLLPEQRMRMSFKGPKSGIILFFRGISDSFADLKVAAGGSI
jgi:hypothetical protein